jgi:hypothetical protein
MTFTNLMWLYKNERELEYRKNDTRSWKPWNPEIPFNKEYQYRCKK